MKLNVLNQFLSSAAAALTLISAENINYLFSSAKYNKFKLVLADLRWFKGACGVFLQTHVSLHLELSPKLSVYLCVVSTFGLAYCS